MKKYKKPELDIVEFDNLDVMSTSDSNDVNSQDAADLDNPIAIHNELEVLNAVDTTPAPSIEATEAPAPTESAPLAETTPEPEDTTPVDDTTVDDVQVDETPADDTADDTVADDTAVEESVPDEDDLVAAESVSEDVVE